MLDRPPIGRRHDVYPQRYVTAGLAIVAGLITFVVFAPGLNGTFLNWDDDRSLLNNFAFRGLGVTQLVWSFTTTLLGHYAPLTWLSFSLTYAVAGMAPWAYHAGNLALHSLNAILVYAVALLLLAAARPGAGSTSFRFVGAFASALLFSIHPLRAETVGWITDRGDVLCGTFYLLSVLAYLKGVTDEATNGARRWRLTSVLAFAAALLSKEIAITLPLTLLLLDYYPLHRFREGWRAPLRDKGVYFLLAIAGAGAAMLARSAVGWTSYASYGAAARLAMAVYSFSFYPVTFVWPSGLSPLYALPLRVDPFQPRFILAAAVVVATTGGLVAGRRRAPAALVAWLHGMIVVAPVSGLTHAGAQLVADRYSYLAGLGFPIMLGGGVQWVADRWWSGQLRARTAAAVGVACTVIFPSLALMSWHAIKPWHDSVSLWEAAVHVDDDCLLCQSKLGTALLAAGNLAAAEMHLQRAVDLAPERPGLHVDLGVALALTGRAGEAEHEFETAMRLSPTLAIARLNLARLCSSKAALTQPRHCGQDGPP